MKVAALWDANVALPPPVLLDRLAPGLASEARAINNTNVIVGRAQTHDSAGNVVFHAAMWDGNSGAVSDLGTLASAVPISDVELNASAESINDSNTVVGVGDFTNAPIRQRAAWKRGAGAAMLLIPHPTSPNAGAWHIAPNGGVALTIGAASSGGPDRGATFRQNHVLNVVGPRAVGC